MSHNYLKLYVHLVWATYLRRPLLSARIRAELFPYAAVAMKGGGARVVLGGGWVDHVHFYIELSSYASVGQVVCRLKARTSGWIRRRFPEASDFAWQRGYGAFSVDPKGRARLLDYIRHQEAHHSRATFDREFHRLLVAHGLGPGGDAHVRSLPRPTLSGGPPGNDRPP